MLGSKKYRRASIGPRLGGAAETVRGSKRSPRSIRFNWAAARRPRRRTFSFVPSRTPNRFNWAAARRPRRPRAGRGTCGMARSFNWAAARRPRRRRDPDPLPVGALRLQLGRGSEAAETSGAALADIGYHAELQLGRGSEAAETQGIGDTSWVGLAASIGPRLGGRGDSPTKSRGPGWGKRFNWAAARRPRRPCPARESRPPLGPASIGPRLGGRGDSRSDGEGQRRSASFNWAAARRPRRPPYSVKWLGRFTAASIGPRLGGRGDGRTRPPACQLPPSLQLGRGSEAAETEQNIRRAEELALASIGPRLGGRGDSRGLVTLLAKLRCFNWAAARRPRRRTWDYFQSTIQRSLQLGRGSEAAETGKGNANVFANVMLQLGRGSEAAETSVAPSPM